MSELDCRKLMIEKPLVNTPPVAACLIAKGYHADIVVNPTKPTHKAWLFDGDTIEFFRDIVEAYEFCRKSVPPYFVRTLERLEKEQSNIAEGGAVD